MCELTVKVFDDFIKWSQLDPEKHATLITIQDWRDEWAEFTCAYTDWLDSQRGNI